MKKKHAPSAHENNRWKDLVDRLPVMIFESDLANEIIYASENVYGTLGYSPDELIGENGLELFHPEDRQYLLQNIRKKLEGKILEPAKYRVRKKSGEYITATFRSVPVLKDGKPAGIMGAAIDISAAEKPEKELAVSKARYRSLFENSSLGIYRTTPDGRILMANAAMIKILGCDSLKDLQKINLGKRDKETGFGRQAFKEKIEKEGRIISFESVWTRKDGKKIWLRENATLIKDEKDVPLYYDGVIEDITFQKNAELLIQEQQDLLNLSQQMAQTGSWVEDLRTGLVLWSLEEYRIFEVLLGIEPNEVLFFSKVHPEDRHLVEGRRLNIIHGQHNQRKLEYRLLLDGKVKWIRSIMESQRDKAGNIVRLYGIDMDITVQKEKQLQLEKESYLLKKSQELGRIGTWELNLKTKQVKASEVLIELYGLLPKARYTMEDFTQRIHPEDMKECGMVWADRSVLKEGGFNSTYRLLVNGKMIWINAVGEVNYDKNGEPETLIAAVQDITRQKLAEIELKELEQQKAAILNAIPDMIFVMDKQGVYKDYVAGVDIQPMVSPEQFLGKKITEVMPSEVAKEHLTLLQKAFATGQIQLLGYQLEVNDETSYFEARISPVDDNKAVVVVSDVTQRENDRKALLETNENLKLYSKAMDESPVSVVITDVQANIQYVNHQFTKITGYLPEEVIGQNPRILKSGFQDSSFYKNLWKTILSGKTWVGEFHNKKKNGDLFWEAVSINPIYNQENEITHFVGIKEDITQKKKDMQIVQEMASIVDSSNAIIIGKTLDGIIRAWNRGAEHVYGYKAEEVIGLPVNIIVPHVLKNELKIFTDRIIAGERVENFETHRICKNGKEVEVSLSLSGIKDEKGILTGISVVGQDITRQKQMERELITEKERAEEASRAKSLFLANMSHEIRTPLNAILGFSNILFKRLKDPVQKEYVESMQSSGKALLNLINDLLDFSKAEAGKLEFNRQSTDVRYLVHDIESIFRLRAMQKHLNFKVSIAKNVPRDLFLDELKIRQVLLNLTGNAIKFTEKGFVKISVKAEDIENDTTSLVLEVQDSGKGIPPTYHKKIFKLFEQQDAEISTRYGGTGLGLAIIHQIVSQMKGHIELVSEEGKGSLFRVVLPDISLTGEKASGRKPEENLQEPVLFEPATVLIVDDTENNRRVLKNFLEDFPFTILEAKEGNEALEHLSNSKVDLVFMDIRMPVMDGIETVKKIRAHEEWSHIPVVALTASSSEFEGEKLEQKGFNAYLRKPASMAQLEKALRDFLRFGPAAQEKETTVILSEGTLKNFNILVEELEKKVMPLQKELLGIKPRQKVRAMAQTLLDIGQILYSEEVKRYGERLMTANANLQLVKEKELIEQFPQWFDQLKKAVAEKR
jgi:PAS domain S-box-containing protein